MSNAFLFFFKGGNYAGLVKKNSKVIRDGRLKASVGAVSSPLPPPSPRKNDERERGW